MPSAIGFLSGLDQPAIRVAADSYVPRQIDFGRLDRWLTGPLGLETRDLDHCTVPPAGWPASEIARQFVNRALALFPELAQACELPCFATGRILELRRPAKVPGPWRLVAMVPWVDKVDAELGSRILGFALVLQRKLCSVEPGPETIAQAHALIQSNLIERARGRIRVGRSTLPVCKVAWRLGIPWRHVGAGTFLLGMGSRARLSDRSASAQDSAIGVRISQDKHATAQLLGRAGLPVPEHRLVARVDQAVKAASVLGWPLVVKPADRDRGEGVTIDLHDEDTLRRAFDTAQALGHRVLVERHVEGVCHRILVAEGEVVFATRRNPKAIRGNGRSTVSELVAKANGILMLEPPWKRRKPYPLDALAIESLKRAGLDPESVPAADSIVPLRLIESTEWGGQSEEVTETIHPDNAAAAVDAAALLGLRVAGVDMISRDLSVPWHENGAIINEVNFAPFFGGNLESPRAKRFLQRLTGGDGRIPVWAVLGPSGLGLSIAKKLQAQQLAAGLRCWMTTAERTDGPSRESFPLRCDGLFDRCIALASRPDVDAMVVSIDDEANLEDGLPVDRFDRCYLMRSSRDVGGVGLEEVLRARTAPDGFIEIEADESGTDLP